MKKFFILFSAIFLLSVVTSCSDYMNDMDIQTGLNEGLVAYWPVIGSDGLNAVRDYSGKGNHITSFANGTMPFDTGKYNTAVKNNGRGLICSKTDFFIKSNGFTFTAWYKNLGFTTSSNNTMLNMTNSGSERFYIQCNDATGYFSIRAANGSTNLVISSSNLFDWSYVTVTYDGDYLRMYLNGTCVGETKRTSSTINIDTANRIDILHENNSYCLGGYLDEIRIYNRALSQDEIKALMNIGID